MHVWLSISLNLFGAVVLVALFVEPLAILEVVVGVVTGEGVWRHLLIRVPEVNVPHVVLVVEHIGEIGIVVPVVVQVILAVPVLENHAAHDFGHAHKQVGPEDGADHVEPGVDGAQKLVIGVLAETLVRGQVREGLRERDEGVLHEAEGAKPEDEHAWHREGSPVTVQVLLNCLMEDTVATISFNSSFSYPLMVSLSMRSLKSPGSLGVMFSSSRGDRAKDS